MDSQHKIIQGNETIQQIEGLWMGGAPAVRLENLVERETRHRAREKLAALLHEQYTSEVCLETLRLNEETPIFED